jgi:acyl carrier protein
MSDEFIQRIRSVVANSQRIPIEKVTIDSSFQELGIDSMDAVNILFGLESEFDISIPDDEVKDIRTVRQMAEGVERLVAAKAARPAPAADSAPAQ